MKSAIIPDYDNYTIYENGDVYSKIRRGGGGKKKQTLSPHGYYMVHLTKDSITKHFFVHRLLGICFIPNPDNKPMIDHIDRDRTNNNLYNLRWATNKENSNNREKPIGSIFISKKYYDNKVYEYYRFCWREDGKRKGKYFKSMEEAEIYRENLFL